jgi:PleD family two-component response regulator
MEKRDVIVVDDQPSVCKEISTFLKDKFTVHAFRSGRETLDYLSKNTTDLILLDYGMPEMTGYEMLMAMRVDKSTKDIPVVFLTGETNDRMKHEMTSRGADDYICKPVNAYDLIRCVEKNLRK